MTGVEILASEEIAIGFCFNWTAFWITTSIFFGLCLIVGIIISIKECNWYNLLPFCVVGIVFSGVFGIIIGYKLPTPVKCETHYKITISDEVSMNEFNEKYEIVDQEGKIYTVRERQEGGNL